MDISGEWWTLFHSKPLNDLIERALTNNPNIKSAQAALTAAHEGLMAQRGAYYPSASAGFSYSRNKTSDQVSPNTASGDVNYSLYTPQVTVSYVPDVFGLNRRTVESFKAQEQQARFQLIATHITLSANVAVAAIQEASLRAQIEATRELVDSSSNMVEVLHRAIRQRLCEPARRRRAGSATGATRRDPAAARQAACAYSAICSRRWRAISRTKPTPTFELSSLKLPRGTAR